MSCYCSMSLSQGKLMFVFRFFPFSLHIKCVNIMSKGKWIRKWWLVLLLVCLCILLVRGLPHNQVPSPVQSSVTGTQMSLFLKRELLEVVGTWSFRNLGSIWITALKIKAGDAMSDNEQMKQAEHSRNITLIAWFLVYKRLSCCIL